MDASPMNYLTRFRGLVVLCSIALIHPLLAAESAMPGGGHVTFRRGVNISHWLSQNSERQPFAAPWFGEDDVEWIAKQGFDHIRLPVDVRLCLAPDGSLDGAKLKPIADCIGWAKKHGLGLVLDAHFLPGADFNSVGGDSRVYTDPALMKQVAGVWRELARHFAGEGPDVRFEILNEPVAAKNQQLNPFMKRMLAAIRESNPTRVVYVTSNKWSSFSTVSDVVLPDDPHIALTVHNYEPLIFTHQRAPWVGLDDTLPPVRFPGIVPDYKAHLTRPADHGFGQPGDSLTVAQVDDAFAKVAAWVTQHRPGLEIYLGEFGVYQAADAASKKRWLHAMVRNCESRGWGWAVWEYEGSFGVRGPDGRGTAVLDGIFQQ
jgi:endoglucanase